jgi:hypothetical protein
MDGVRKILTPKKKRSKCRHEAPPSEICKFPPCPSEISQRSKDADRINLSETTDPMVTLQKNSSIEGGVDIKWNGPTE